MQLKQIFLLAISLIFVASCSSLRVNYDYDTQADFTQFDSYQWLPMPKKSDANPLNRKRFVTAVDKELKEKGFTNKDEGADLLLAVHFVKETKLDIETWGYTYAPVQYYRGYGYRYPDNYRPGVYATTNNVTVHEYEKGTLVLDFIDSQSKRLAWRATATAIISPEKTPQEQTEKINNAVKEILQAFPPK